MPGIDASNVEYIAALAKIKLSASEKETFGPQLGGILKYIEKLNELDTSGVEPTSHALKITNVSRPDEGRPSLAPDEALGNAPDRSDDFYRVPRIIE